jgi:hypothetical protein
MIDPEGLFYGDRLRRCSQTARLYWPYFFLASNGFGRLELNYRRICYRLFVDFEEPPTEEDFWGYIKEYRDAHLLFLYEHRGQIWGQWDAKTNSLPRWKTQKDREAPEPPKEEYQKWLTAHRTESKALPKSSEILRNLTKTSEEFRTSRVEKSSVEKSREEEILSEGFDFDAWLNSLHSNHPRKGKQQEARLTAQAILVDTPNAVEQARAIQRQHSKYLAYWRNCEFQFVPFLCNWLRRPTPEGQVYPWLEDPPEPLDAAKNQPQTRMEKMLS